MKKNENLKLKLNRETLSTLGTLELEAVVGGTVTPNCKSGYSCYNDC
jgi:hypothetical protein